MRTIRCLCLLFVAFCSSAMAGPADDAVQVVDQWAKAFSAADVDGVVGLYDAEAVFMGTGTKTIVTDTAGVRKYFEAGLLGSRRFAASFVDRSVVPLSDTIVVVTVLDKLVVTGDGPTREVLGRVTFIVAKRAAGWKIVHFHRSAMPA